MMARRSLAAGIVVSMLIGASSIAHAQDPAPLSSPWSVDLGFGMDNSISGNINSSAIGRINNQAVVILKNCYEDVYGTGLHFRLGGGYMLDDDDGGESHLYAPVARCRSHGHWAISGSPGCTGNTLTIRASG